MIAYIIGMVTEVAEDNIIVENGQIGFNIRVPYGYAFQVGTEVKIYTYTYVKEDAFQLYGFEAKDELALFKKLITVSGIGPKGALAILSVMSAGDLRFAIYSQDVKAISKAPGIGKRTAERVILDLKDKVSLEDITSIPGQMPDESVDSMQHTDAVRKDVVDALAALGYGVSEAAKAVARVVITEETTTEEILKNALKYML